MKGKKVHGEERGGRRGKEIKTDDKGRKGGKRRSNRWKREMNKDGKED